MSPDPHSRTDDVKRRRDELASGTHSKPHRSLTSFEPVQSSARVRASWLPSETWSESCEIGP